MVDELIFLVGWPVTPRDVVRFGLDLLSSEGFKVKVFDLSLLLNAAALRSHPVADAVEGGYVSRFASYDDLDSKIRRAAPTAAFIDYLKGLDGIDFRTRRVFRMLKRHSACYYIVSAGALPLYGVDPSAGVSAYIMNKLRKAADPARLARFIAKKAIAGLTRYANMYPAPDGIFSSGESEVLERFLNLNRLGMDCVILVHSLDYDTYLHYMRGLGWKPPELEKTCVFLDEALTNHPDFSILGIRPIGAGPYFKSMCRLFDAVERQTGLKVVIAAHPRSACEDMQDAYGGREIIKGKTIDLVARASLVVAHTSTAVSFAVLFARPLVLTKTAEMVEKGFSGLVDVMAASLGVNVVNIDDAAVLARTSFNPDANMGSRYEEYKYKYIKSRGAGDFTVWEMVAGYLKGSHVA
ncbi:MAG: hypothetical protein HZB85_04515 [Deltaproteobacteria bacterium]|nr:hypothetical protein [Deltaproteobacteria bacterium]